MSGIGIKALPKEYQGGTGFVYERIGSYSSEAKGESVEVSVFYNIIRLLSTIVVCAFLVLLVSSVVIGGPIHWSIAVVGCLGSIGLAGAVWLSKSYIKGKSM